MKITFQKKSNNGYRFWKTRMKLELNQNDEICYISSKNFHQIFTLKNVLQINPSHIVNLKRK